MRGCTSWLPQRRFTLHSSLNTAMTKMSGSGFLNTSYKYSSKAAALMVFMLMSVVYDLLASFKRACETRVTLKRLQITRPRIGYRFRCFYSRLDGPLAGFEVTSDNLSVGSPSSRFWVHVPYEVSKRG